MFELVADVERYPEFVPLCEALTVLSRTRDGEGREVVTASMTVAYKLLRESFVSRVVLDREARRISVDYNDGPFKNLENVWSFLPAGEQSCEVGFKIAYEFRSRLFQALMGAVFDKAFRKFSTAFEARADEVYGRKAPGQGGEQSAAAAPVKASPPASAS
jgi:coenzyme Q-binding protein COQ10